MFDCPEHTQTYPLPHWTKTISVFPLNSHFPRNCFELARDLIQPSIYHLSLLCWGRSDRQNFTVYPFLWRWQLPYRDLRCTLRIPCYCRIKNLEVLIPCDVQFDIENKEKKQVVLKMYGFSSSTKLLVFPYFPQESIVFLWDWHLSYFHLPKDTVMGMPLQAFQKFQTVHFIIILWPWRFWAGSEQHFPRSEVIFHLPAARILPYLSSIWVVTGLFHHYLPSHFTLICSNLGLLPISSTPKFFHPPFFLLMAAPSAVAKSTGSLPVEKWGLDWSCIYLRNRPIYLNLLYGNQAFWRLAWRI